MAEPLHAELLLRVQPRASRAEVSGERDGRLLVRVTAPAADNAANEAVRTLLAKRLGIAKGRVLITRGHSSRLKSVRVEGLSGAEARAQLLRPG